MAESTDALTQFRGAGTNLPRGRIYERALDARDARFDGIFFVGITTTNIYCRPICPTRRARSDHRRFFHSAAAAERAGFRPCLRCRPELAPGRAWADAVPRLAYTAARRIAAGALNGGTVTQLAEDLGVSARHLRRALKREVGVSPLELAQTHRLLLAKRLLADTRLTLLSVASSSGFQSVRRFNAVFRERYGMSPGAVRKGLRSDAAENSRGEADEGREGRQGVRRNEHSWRRNGHGPSGAHVGLLAEDLGTDLLRLTLSYRAPFAWNHLLVLLRRDAMPGVELIERGRYGRTVAIGERTGVVFAGPAADGQANHLNIEVSTSLLPVLMPLLVRLRQLFDLDAEPAAIETCLEQSGLGDLVVRRRGLRLPGAFDGFEVAWGLLLRGPARPGPTAMERAERVIREIGGPIETGISALTHLPPSAESMAETGASGLAALGVPPDRARAISALASEVANGRLRLEAGGDVAETRRALLRIYGIGERLATTIVMRALSWPDAFPATERALQRAAGARGPGTLLARAESWRPWRAYAALHLRLSDQESKPHGSA